MRICLLEHIFFLMIIFSVLAFIERIVSTLTHQHKLIVYSYFIGSSFYDLRYTWFVHCMSLMQLEPLRKVTLSPPIRHLEM